MEWKLYENELLKNSSDIFCARTYLHTRTRKLKQMTDKKIRPLRNIYIHISTHIYQNSSISIQRIHIWYFM